MNAPISKNVERQTGRAAHERRDQDRGQPVAAIFDYARGHDPRHRARHGREHRNERLAAQAAAGHELVHQEGRPRHVAAVFQDGQEAEENHDLGQEDDDRADAFKHAVDQQACQRAGREKIAHLVSEPILAVADPVHERFRAREDRLKDEEHDEEKGQRAPEAVGQHAVDAVGPGGGPASGPMHAAGSELPNPAVAGAGFDRRDWATRLGETFPGRIYLRADILAVEMGEPLFRVAPHVKQKPPNQERGHLVAQRFGQACRFALKCVRKRRPELRRFRAQRVA